MVALHLLPYKTRFHTADVTALTTRNLTGKLFWNSLFGTSKPAAHTLLIFWHVTEFKEVWKCVFLKRQGFHKKEKKGERVQIRMAKVDKLWYLNASMYFFQFPFLPFLAHPTKQYSIQQVGMKQWSWLLYDFKKNSSGGCLSD